MARPDPERGRPCPQQCRSSPRPAAAARPFPAGRFPSYPGFSAGAPEGHPGGRVSPTAHPRAADHRPYFYLSYAHTPRHGTAGTDPDMWVERLFGDLCGHVMAMTDLSAGESAGFMDREMRSGEGWPERLGEFLATCRVFVPLFSPRYFTSEMCGKEWQAFEQRAIRHRASTNQPADAIVPALWVPVPEHQLPGPAARLQLDHRDFGDRYLTEGLYGLIRLRRFAEDYEHAVYELAKRIISTADAIPIAPGRPSDYHRTPSAFGTGRTGPHPMHFTVAAPTLHDLPEGRDRSYYGDSSLDWNPYHPSSARPLAFMAEDIGRSLNYQVTVSALDEDAPYRDGRHPPSRPEVLLVDRWALKDPARRARLAAFDADQPWASVVVPWNPDDSQSGAEAEALNEQLVATMPSTMRSRPAVGWAAVKGVRSLDAFAQLLPQVVETAAQQYLRHAAIHPPAGVGIAERPRLTGPTGGPAAARPGASRPRGTGRPTGAARPTGAGSGPSAAAPPLRSVNPQPPAQPAAARARAHVALADDDPRTGTPVRLTVELVAESAHPWARPEARPPLDVVAVPLSRADIVPATASYGPGDAGSVQFSLTAAEPGRHGIRFTFVHHDTGVVLQQVETHVDVAGPEPAAAGQGRS
ncbi:TIR-like protein FxsC [Streptomyces sp. B21-097]|uniref:TIR-like protein FxsC n=1 Tax=Streptomyces sp. B21-097 TaxID=3039414 RepID=UPI002FF241DA